MMLPLEGIRVIDLGRVWAGPLAALILADFGAEVIKVETMSGRGDFTNPETIVVEDFPEKELGSHPWNRSGIFNDLNRNKKSLTLDLSNPAGKDVFKKLVAVSDVVIDNYTPRVMINFGLDYGVLKAVKPNIIMLSMPAYGMSGHYRDIPGFGNTIESVAGITNLTGYAGEAPHLPGMITGDVIAALHGVSALLVALQHRRLTGTGQHIDLSQAEAQTSIIGKELIEYQLTKQEPERIGNNHPCMSPHGCYKCSGEDKWVAIAVASEVEWEGLCKAMGNPDWTNEARFSTLTQRLRHQKDLDKFISKWTEKMEHIEVMELLQFHGVPCGALFNGRELLDNEHLKQRGFIIEIPHPEAGVHRYAGTPVKLSETPAQFYLPAPLLGEHNQIILKQLLNFNDDEINELIRLKALG
ncbi:MAG TPA: CoA transferase [Dehalococcoidales bacterium]|nr:CoA transferase [Dehalococcoidales bacterium]